MYKYISVGMDYGPTVSGFEGYRNIQEIIKEMDRLGISQSVVEYNGLSNSLACNKKLLEDIASVPGGRERLIPGFNLNPSALFQRNAMEQIIEMLENNRPHCIILKPEGHGYQLMMAETVLEKISYLNPVCLINETQLREPGAVDDLVYLAKKFSNMRFVVRRFIWTGVNRAFNAARQADNIYIDISRLHTTHGIELSCEYLGAHRVLWGHSRKSGMGAAMAAVTYAEVSEETKDKIRWGNFVELFQDPQDKKLLLVRPVPVALEDPPDMSRYLVNAWKPKPGGGYSENHELRLYRPGDNLHQVHWKLSAKTGKMILREPMEAIRGLSKVTLLLRGTPGELDQKLGKLCWVSLYLLQKEVPHQIQCLTGRGMVDLDVSGQEDVLAALDVLLKAPVAEKTAQPEYGYASWRYHIGGDGDEE